MMRYINPRFALHYIYITFGASPPLPIWAKVGVTQ